MSFFPWDLLISSRGLVELTFRASVVSSSLDDAIDAVVGVDSVDVAELVVLKVVFGSMEGLGFKGVDEENKLCVAFSVFVCTLAVNIGVVSGIVTS